jgi:hypothetical protein
MKRILMIAGLVSSLALAQTPPIPSLTWYWTAPSQFTDGNAIPSTDTITYNVMLGTAGPGSELATANQTGDRFPSAVTSGAYTAGMKVCVQVVAVDSAANTIPSPPSVEFCQTYEPPSQQISAPINVSNKAPTGG